MLEVIGFIVWLVFTVWLTALPFLMLVASGLGGGLDKTEKVFLVCIFLGAVYNWSRILSTVSIDLN
ncbi:MAG: hypothetical protein ACI9RI_000872 [Oceanospirillaceae bacterium]|jgi:hypothetical protein